MKPGAAYLEEGDLLDMVARPADWVRIKNCAVCSLPFTGDSGTRRGFCVHGQGFALFRMHTACAERAWRNPNAQRKLVAEAGTNIDLLVGQPGGHG